jgi:hypothetical protein
MEVEVLVPDLLVVMVDVVVEVVMEAMLLKVMGMAMVAGVVTASYKDLF